MMGVCFECLLEIDGIDNRRACQVEVKAGMQVRRQLAASGGEAS
jgi:predicted molibdopterin-dependent oxidoreductase YjgC